LARERQLAGLERELATIEARYNAVAAEAAMERQRLEDLLRGLHEQVAALEARAGLPTRTEPLITLDPVWGDPRSAPDTARFPITLELFTDAVIEQHILPLLQANVLSQEERDKLVEAIAVGSAEKMRFMTKYVSLFRELSARRLAWQAVANAGPIQAGVMRPLRLVEGTNRPVADIDLVRRFSRRLFLLEGAVASIAAGILAAMLAHVFSTMKVIRNHEASPAKSA
jgi:hypothetical protein